nr:hypothetical protein BaRGS_026612 [Batillaria attramentaria]
MTSTELGSKTSKTTKEERKTARGYGQFPLTADDLPVPGAKYGGLTKGTLPDDSGFSSRVSEDSASLHRTVEIRELRKAVTEVAIEDDKGITEGCCSVRSVVRGIVKILGVFILLYIFICSLDLLSNAFRLLGGKTAGSVFQDNELLQNPITGLMIGVLSTVILQSSSTSTSIVITMVSSGILEVRPAIPIIMGANIGTTVTNTLVSLAHSMDPKEFRRAFSGATVHDVFNWLTVLILLPLEYACGYLYHLTSEIVKSLNMEQLRTKKQDLLKQLTKPLTSRIVQIDKKVITAIAEGKEGYDDARLLKIYCDTLLVKLGMGDMGSGLLLFSASVLILSVCLYFMVKLLHSILGGHVARMAKKTINANFPGPFSCLTDYVAILVGAGMTILVQSSSVFTSALTPLVGVGCLKLERMYPLTLGSNIGTTATGILAALASSSSTMQLALQLALCHLFFNISGILLFFPIPFMRRIPLRAARFLGRTTARYRWFAIFYLMLVFLVFPGCFLALSFAGKTVFLIAVALIGAVVLAIVIINVLQCSRFRSKLPTWLQTWEWLPLCLRSLQPLDRVFRAMCSPLSRICCACCVDKCRCLGEQNGEESVDSDTESEDDTDSESDDSEYSQTDASCCCCGRNRRSLQPL